MQNVLPGPEMTIAPRQNHWLITALLLLLPLLITYEAVLRDHTISYISGGGGVPTRGINSLPLLDPSAGSHQDEPWSYLIGSSWAKGEIPLINQANGLGAPLLASLQSGALYPGNLLLMMLPKSSAQFFDWFSVAHVVLLAFGLYYLARRFTEESWVAALIAGSLAASLATVYNINMVHFRAFAWAPWMAVGLIDLLRRPGINRGSIGLFLIACFCSFAAGNPQESILDLAAVIMVVILVMYKDATWRHWWVLAAVIGVGLLIASITMLPYLIGIANSDLWSVADPGRSGVTIHFAQLLEKIVPRGSGYAGDIWFYGINVDTLQFALPVIWLLGLVGWSYAFIRQPRQLKWTLPLALTLVVFAAKLVGIGPWGWISSIPVFNGIRFTKYTLWTVLIFLPLVVIGIDCIQSRCREHSPLAMPFTLAIFLIFVVAFAGYLVDFKWQPDLKSGGTRLAVAMALVSMAAGVTLPLLMTRRHRTILVLLWAVGLAVLLRPAGFHREIPYESMRYHTPPTQLVPADLSDQNWDRGVHRGKPGFFVSNPSTVSHLVVGDPVNLPTGQTRTIQRVSGDQVWLDGAELLNPVTDGYPHPIALDPTVNRRFQDLAQMMVAPWPRVADAGVTPNTNLILGNTSPWVFDPVMNRRYRDLVTREFATFNPGFDTHPATPYPLTPKQVDVMRMLGVGLILGHSLPGNPYYRALGPATHKIHRGLLPEAIVIPESLVPELEALFLAKRYGAFVDRILSEGQACAVERPGPNELTVVVPPGAGQRRVLVNRVFMGGWSSASGVLPVADFWLAATVDSEGGGQLAFRYWPPGLTLGLLLAGAGLAGLLVLIMFDRHRAKKVLACPV